LVQEQQVDLVDAELAGALVEAVQRLVVAVVGDPDFRLDENLRPVDARVGEAFADLLLVEVGGGGVDRGALKLSLSRCRTAISRSVPRRLRLFNLGVGSPTRACHEVNPDPWKLPQLLGDTGDHEQRFSSIGIQID
jgi:hypothetical protein